MRTSIFSAIGSLPLHLAPIVVYALTLEGWSLVAASTVASMAMVGLLLAASVQTVLERSFWSPFEIVALVGLHTALVLLSIKVGPRFLPLVWLSVGFVSGLFMQIGILSAAEARDKFSNFVVRLACALVLSGVVALFAWGGPCEDPFIGLAVGMSLVSVLVYASTVLGARIILAQPSRARAASVERQADRPGGGRPARSGFLALLVLALFFLATTAFLTHIAEALRAASATSSTAFVIGAAKVGSGCLLALVLFLLRGVERGKGPLACLALLAVLALASDTVLAAFAVTLLLTFEIVFNVSSSALMAQVAEAATHRQRRAILLAALSGGAAGPLVGAGIIELASFDALRVMSGAAVAGVAAWMLFPAIVAREA